MHNLLKLKNMLRVPKKHDYPWGYEITWAQGAVSVAKILHINKNKQYKWTYQDNYHETIHCLFGSIFVVTYDGQEKIWPGDSYVLDSNVKEVNSGAEDAEVLFLAEKK